MEEGLETILEREGRHMPRETIGKYIKLGLYLICFLPIFFLLLVPFSIVVSVYLKCFGKKEKQENDDDEEEEKYRLPQVEDVLSFSDRKYDIVLFGATGFTGKFAAKHLARTYGSSISWAIAGRKLSKLEQIREELTEIDSSLADLPIIVADTSNEESLHDLVRDTRCVSSTVGPFDKYGTPLVKFCVAYGTHYTDITGELAWVRVMIEKYAAEAEKTGAKIVSLCGQDCVPYDTMVYLLNNKLDGKPMRRVKLFDEMYGTFSGGTIATLIHSLTGSGRKKKQSSLGFDPLDRVADDHRTSNRLKDKSPILPKYFKERGKWTSFFVMSSVNSGCIRRSNAFLKYGSKLEYIEAMVEPGFASAWTSVLALLVTGYIITNPVVRRWAFSLGLLPKPGQGPSDSTIEKGYLRLYAHCTAEDGTEADGWIFFPKNSGYEDTGRMLVETALSMALQPDEIPPIGGGHFTPAVACGQVLVDRLVKTGTKIQF